jgi:hypothetical protein
VEALMAIHATERDRNIIRTIMVGLATVDLGGFALLPDGDDRAPGEGTPSWVRVSVLTTSAETRGRSAASTLDTRHDILVSCEVYRRTAGFEGGSAVDAIEAPVEALRHYFTARNLTINDYVTDPTGATATGHAIRFIEPPRRERLPPLDGFERRIVAAEAIYFSQHTG